MWEKDGGGRGSVPCTTGTTRPPAPRVAASRDDTQVRRFVKCWDYSMCVCVGEGQRSIVGAVMHGLDRFVTSVSMSGGTRVVPEHAFDDCVVENGRDSIGRQQMMALCSLQYNASLTVSNLADENVNCKEQVSDELSDEVFGPLATQMSFSTSFGYVITTHRKPYIAQIDVVHVCTTPSAVPKTSRSPVARGLFRDDNLNATPRQQVVSARQAIGW